LDKSFIKRPFRFDSPSLSSDSFAISLQSEISGMDLRIKCKNCRRGILEPTFKGNEFRCFVCGYDTEVNLT
jgi:hypothetical protein